MNRLDEVRGEDAARRFDDLQNDGTLRWVLIGVGAIIGLALAWVHWLGLLVGGVLVSLPTRDWRRGILAGLGFGVLALLVFAGLLAARGALAPALEMGQITLLAVAIPLVAGGIGGLARGLV
ncbi:hypothetical protein [Haladaptatus sp. NG-SE-30]